MNSQALYEQFKEKAEAVSAQVTRAATPRDALAEIAGYLRDIGTQRGEGFTTVWAPSPVFNGLDLEAALDGVGPVYFERLDHHARDALVGVAEADLAIAETGTLGQDATDLDKRLATTLPFISILVVRTGRLIPTMADALERFSAGLPGYLALITGPSRTADIERVLTIGVHGPEYLWVIFVDGEGGENDG
ncbi:hypothetical protein SY88_09985 [Clostridiales bacterium PH28_bin88]|nr:hypothetical protein SY88_09985 [Clostridiales bacterium PH28_bin88]